MKVQSFAWKELFRPGGGWLGLLVALLLFMLGLSVWSARSAVGELEDAQRELSEVTRTVRDVQRLQFLAAELNGWLTHYALDVATGGPGVVPGNVYGLSFGAALSEMNASLGTLRTGGLLRGREPQQLSAVDSAVQELAAVDSAVKQLAHLANQAQAAYSAGTPEKLREGYALVRGEAFTAYQAALTPINQLSENVISRSDVGALVAHQAAERAATRLLRFSVGAGVLVLLLTLLVIDLLRRRERLVQQFRALADTDGLTGLSNRRHWESVLARELAVQGRRAAPVSLVMIDLDHFKAFNDRFGHQSGDDLLRALAELLSDDLHPPALAARYGGEEFSLLLPGHSLADAQIWLGALRSRMPYGQNFSAGLTLLSRHDTPLTAMARADDALYAAKRAGRAQNALAPADQLHGEPLQGEHGAPLLAAGSGKRLPR
jgi:diguanylate cyclase (GGDEF)-like protein